MRSDIPLAELTTHNLSGRKYKSKSQPRIVSSWQNRRSIRKETKASWNENCTLWTSHSASVGLGLSQERHLWLIFDSFFSLIWCHSPAAKCCENLISLPCSTCPPPLPCSTSPQTCFGSGSLLVSLTPIVSLLFFLCLSKSLAMSASLCGELHYQNCRLNQWFSRLVVHPAILSVKSPVNLKIPRPLTIEPLVY